MADDQDNPGVRVPRPLFTCLLNEALRVHDAPANPLRVVEARVAVQMRSWRSVADEHWRTLWSARRRARADDRRWGHAPSSSTSSPPASAEAG